MNFSHECSAVVEKSVDHVCEEWSSAENLASLLTHVRAAEVRDDEPDIARLLVTIEGRLVEIPAQRTMSEKGLICWQSLDPHKPYLLNAQVSKEAAGKTRIVVTVSYDPPGVLPDIVETLGGGASFAGLLESDLQAYRGA
jgi:uncharacterized membrane protein